MAHQNIIYRGVVLHPIAAYDDGTYAAMSLVKEQSGEQRATGVIDHFTSAGLARQAAIDFGIAMIDGRYLPCKQI